jgi:PIN domain nuclease of toxin-antitoxin system
VRLLLDTHILLWWLADAPELAPAERAAISDGANEVVVSAASAWEVAIKQATGKLRVPDGLGEAVASAGFGQVPIAIEHALLAGALPPHHNDPFDRMLIAQAQVEHLTIVTRDARFQMYGIPLLAA